MPKNYLIAILLAAVCVTSLGCQQNMEQASESEAEVMYHIFLRSFYDSDGDQNGDINGVTQKLDYLENLGVTSLLISPIFESVYYHNYFADDFEKIDPDYGTMDDWIRLVEQAHHRGMKIYLDMEIQYVTKKQTWFKDSFKNPSSPYSDYIIYNGPGNTKPEPIIFNISLLEGYNDSTRTVATLNLHNKEVRNYFTEQFSYWMDPNEDGNFSDGVDGFRIDHMMDDLDNKGILTDLFDKFWCPMISDLRKENSQIKIIAEQANWMSYGTEYFTKGCSDAVFAFGLMYAIATFDKSKLSAIADTTFSRTLPDKEQIVFVENHDTDRFASLVNQNKKKMHAGAALQFLIGGTPSIYYGQELGMFGEGGFGHFGNDDGNDIPKREAFEWFKADTGSGMAVWYKNTGPWWAQTNLVPNDGVSLPAQQNDKSSLWHFYKDMISLHKSTPAIASGKYAGVTNNNEQAFSFARYTEDDVVLVVVNLSETDQAVNLDMSSASVEWNQDEDPESLYGDANVSLSSDSLSLNLEPYGIRVLELK